MDVHVEEVNTKVTLFDIDQMQTDIVRMVMARIDDEQRLRQRRDEETRLRRTAYDRPDGVA
jgi:hypothetical protein